MLVNWEDHYLTGVELIDAQHKELFTVARRISKLLNDDSPSEKRKFACMEGIKYLKSFLLQHYAAEEAYMRQIGYDGYAAHKRMHDSVRDVTLPGLDRELQETDYSEESIQKFLGLGIGWLVKHIATDDLAIVGRGVTPRPLMSEIDLLFMEMAISEVTERNFGSVAKMKIVNPAYTGEYFGKAVYHKLSYDYIVDGRQITVLAGIEEPLLLHASNVLLGVRPDHVTPMILSLAENISQALLQQLGQRFGISDSQYKHTRSEFLSVEQFSALLEQTMPDPSLLCACELGMMAICIYHAK